MILTARELIQKLANDTGLHYSAVAKLVNRSMQKGRGLIESVRIIAEDYKLNPKIYKINPENIVSEAVKILREDYTQTLMISAVLGQMVESKGKDRFPPPAFFAFIEILSEIENVPRDSKSETSTEIEERTTRMIELMTTLVSLLCDWSELGVNGIAFDCPDALREIARAVFRKTKLLQGGLWTCISCGNIVDVKETRALMCVECDNKIDGRRSLEDTFETLGGRTRSGYGRTEGK
ncbi:hypothetical protein EU527_13980 [Candidatus Thorarchaeota archaeon]|nr:MAG: hypothetical protein EU527_13980 [Candidatus Thorarchaeota archaeon]